MDRNPPAARRRRASLVAAVTAALSLVAACAAQPRTGAAGAPAGGTETPVEVTRAFYGALHAGDAAAAARLVASPGATEAAASFVKMAAAYRSLEDALRERYGEAAAHVVGYADRVAAEKAALVEAHDETEGDRATVSAGDRPLARLRRVGGAWRVVLDERLGAPGGAAAMARDAEASRHAAERVVPAIRAGLFADPEDALEAFRNEVTVVMQGGDPELPRPPPGGVGL